jgi:chemotaxis protein methyltransferase CheR
MEARHLRQPEASLPTSGLIGQERDFAFTASDFAKVRELIYARAGISLSDHKRDMVYSRLARRLRARGLDSFAIYLAQLEREDDPAEWEAFTNALTTNLTAFFRESHHFPLLAAHVANRRGPVSIWCCAASTGEEPYSIAITLQEAMGQRAASDARILATDLDTQVLARGDRGVYTADSVKGLSPERLRNFFLRGTGANAGQAKVKPVLRSMIRFEALNLMDATWQAAKQGPFDAIFCRNVMIYFDKPTQGRILERFAPLLKPDGILFAGHSENFTYVTRSFRLRGQTVYELAGSSAAVRNSSATSAASVEPKPSRSVAALVPEATS